MSVLSKVYLIRESYFDYQEYEYLKGEGGYKFLYQTKEEAEIKLRALELEFFKEKNLQKLFKLGSVGLEVFEQFIETKVETAQIEIKKVEDFKLKNRSITWTALGKQSLDQKAINELKQLFQIIPFIIVEKPINQVDLVYEINCNYYFWGKTGIFWDDIYFERLIRHFVLEKKEMLYKAFEYYFHNLFKAELPGLKGEITTLTNFPDILMIFLDNAEFLSYNNIGKEIICHSIKSHPAERKKLIEEFIQLQELLKEPPFKYKRMVLGKNYWINDSNNELKIKTL